MGVGVVLRGFESLRELPPEPEVGLPRPISRRLPSYHFAGWLHPLNVHGHRKEHIISGVSPLTMFCFTMRCTSSILVAVGCWECGPLLCSSAALQRYLAQAGCPKRLGG